MNALLSRKNCLETPLHTAIRTDRVYIAKYLYLQNADVNIKVSLQITYS